MFLANTNAIRFLVWIWHLRIQFLSVSILIVLSNADPVFASSRSIIWNLNILSSSSTKFCLLDLSWCGFDLKVYTFEIQLIGIVSCFCLQQNAMVSWVIQILTNTHCVTRDPEVIRLHVNPSNFSTPPHPNGLPASI